MESKKEEKGTFSPLRLTSTLILPGFLLFLCWVGASIRKDPQQAIGMIILMVIAGLIVAGIGYAIFGAVIITKDVVVVETKKGLEYLNPKPKDDKDKKK